MNLPSPTLLAQAILSGIFVGALYGLLGLGLSLSWGLLRQINLSHFALAFLGAYLSYQLATVGGVDPLVTLLELMTFLLSVSLCVAVWATLRYTDLGKAIRAAAEDAPIAAAFGVNQRTLAALLSGVCAALAGAAGVCLALTYTLTPSQLYAWIGVVFAAVMIGGLGSALGPLLAGIVIGVSEAITMALTAPSWAPLVSFSLLIVVLLVRPGRA